ncbi:MAG: hypothetical protein WDW38_003644 [Sanguina aurantia]
MTTTRLEMVRPDDWHLHLRDGDALASVVGHTARQFARAIVMPNLKPPVTTVAMAEDYRRRILASLPASTPFEPLMTLYLTESTPVEEIRRASESDSVVAVKYYPAGATTNSQSGVRELSRVYPVLEAMEQHDVPLLLHGEVTDPDIDIFDRERVFIERHLLPLQARFPGLRMVLEHITTREAVEFVRGAPANVAATITAHHLLLNRNALFEGGMRPHNYCAPILKRETHRTALLQAATSGDSYSSSAEFVASAPSNVAATITPQHMLLNRNAMFVKGLRPHNYCLPILKREKHREAVAAAATSGSSKFFLGTDSAPHTKHTKEAACGCAGMFTAPVALALYAHAFELAGALHNLEAFASHNGPAFYGLPRNLGSVTLQRTPFLIPESYPLGASVVVPMWAGETIGWSVVVDEPAAAAQSLEEMIF